MKNKLHLGGALGLIFIGMGGFFTFILLMDLYSDYRYSIRFPDRSSFDIRWEQVYALVLGIGYLLAGGGLLGKAKWGSLIGSITLLGSILGWAYIVYDEFRFRLSPKGDIWFEIGLTVCVFVLLFWGLLFLGNDKVKEDFGDEDKEFWEDNILDA